MSIFILTFGVSPGWQDSSGASNPDVSSTHLPAAPGARG